MTGETPTGDLVAGVDAALAEMGRTDVTVQPLTVETDGTVAVMVNGRWRALLPEPDPEDMPALAGALAALIDEQEVTE